MKSMPQPDKSIIYGILVSLPILIVGYLFRFNPKCPGPITLSEANLTNCSLNESVGPVIHFQQVVLIATVVIIGFSIWGVYKSKVNKSNRILNLFTFFVLFTSMITLVSIGTSSFRRPILSDAEIIVEDGICLSLAPECGVCLGHEEQGYCFFSRIGE